MAWSAGTYTKGNSATGGWAGDESLGIGIESGRHDTQDNDFATGINTCLTKDGQNSATADLPMGGFKHTNVANGSARNQYAAIGQVQDGTMLWGGTSGGTANAQTLTLSPAITSYVAGQAFRFIAGATNTAAATLQINGIASPKTIISADTGANIVAGNITTGRLYTVVYDGTNFQLLNESRVWQTYTPTLTQGAGVTFTNNYAKYVVEGKKVTCQVSLVATSAGTAANLITVSLPIASATSSLYRVIGAGTFIDASPSTTYVCAAVQNNTTTVAFHHDTSAANNFGVAPAVTIASGDYINLEVVYEIA